jgi:hypothetical protein
MGTWPDPRNCWATLMAYGVHSDGSGESPGKEKAASEETAACIATQFATNVEELATGHIR